MRGAGWSVRETPLAGFPVMWAGGWERRSVGRNDPKRPLYGHYECLAKGIIEGRSGPLSLRTAGQSGARAPDAWLAVESGSDSGSVSGKGCSSRKPPLPPAPPATVRAGPREGHCNGT